MPKGLKRSPSVVERIARWPLFESTSKQQTKGLRGISVRLSQSKRAMQSLPVGSSISPVSGNSVSDRDTGIGATTRCPRCRAAMGDEL